MGRPPRIWTSSLMVMHPSVWGGLVFGLEFSATADNLAQQKTLGEVSVEMKMNY